MECSWKVGLRGLTAVAVLLIGGTAVARAQFAGPAMSAASASAGAPAAAMHLDYRDVYHAGRRHFHTDLRSA